jgi:uncharacterized membrane protein YidH (DUF202 family)
MKPRQLALAVTAVAILSFAILIVAFAAWPREGDTFRVYVTKEGTKNALELLTLTLVGVLINEMVRRARDRNDFARRVRVAYGKAKARRRRLRRVSTEEERRKELNRLDDVQLEFEELKDEAEREFGERSNVFSNLKSIEKYLNDVIDAGLPTQPKPVTNPDAFQDFVARYNQESRFAKELKGAYHSIRELLG